ncbi:hypothetical protein Gohar_003398 [Gossypium harknessii]|uniref:Uncharacterized protein n=1 Tax=Gossypium harknessii TaxID=34285 RepID=A0A7J9HRJ4_9ROSI|nr:hypothetical protein [Gossypium harknessii]
MSSAEKMKIELAKVRDEFKMSESDCGSARVQASMYYFTMLLGLGCECQIQNGLRYGCDIGILGMTIVPVFTDLCPMGDTLEEEEVVEVSPKNRLGFILFGSVEAWSQGYCRFEELLELVS